MVELSFLKRHESIKKLIDFGSHGYYPIFDSDINLSEITGIKLTKGDKLKAKSLLKKISGQKSLEKQRVIFSSFRDNERQIVARALLELVEGTMLDANPHLQ